MTPSSVVLKVWRTDDPNYSISAVLPVMPIVGDTVYLRDFEGTWFEVVEICHVIPNNGDLGVTNVYVSKRKS